MTQRGQVCWCKKKITPRIALQRYNHPFSGLSLSFETAIANEDSPNTGPKNLNLTSSELSCNRCYGLRPLMTALPFYFRQFSVYEKPKHFYLIITCRSHYTFILLWNITCYFSRLFHKKIRLYIIITNMPDQHQYHFFTIFFSYVTFIS